MPHNIIHPESCTCCGDMLRARFDRRRFCSCGGGGGPGRSLPLARARRRRKLRRHAADLHRPALPGTDRRLHERPAHDRQIQPVHHRGASIAVVAPAFETWAPAFWDNLATSIQLHQIPKVIVVNHRDCGAAKIAYGEAKVANPQIEAETHKAALLQFRKEVAERQPTLTTELHLMPLDGKLDTIS
jgi:hypothetical protein